MPGHVDAALHKFNHPVPQITENIPHRWNKPIYGATIQYAPTPNNAKLLLAPQITQIQQTIGTLLYYSLAVDPTMLIALGSIATEQAKATTNTARAVVKLLNYAATHLNATIWYGVSNMILYTHSNASYYSSALETRSLAGGLFFLSQ
jgi:hypothetical protein